VGESEAARLKALLVGIKERRSRGGEVIEFLPCLHWIIGRELSGIFKLAHLTIIADRK
jgi:hypothetical protein